MSCIKPWTLFLASSYAHKHHRITLYLNVSWALYYVKTSKKTHQSTFSAVCILFSSLTITHPLILYWQYSIFLLTLNTHIHIHVMVDLSFYAYLTISKDGREFLGLLQFYIFKSICWITFWGTLPVTKHKTHIT